MTATDKSATEREAFETWARSQNWFCSCNSFGEYTYETERSGWDAWQARAALTTPSKEPAGAVARTDTTLLDIERAVKAYGNARACAAMDTATLKAELMRLIEAALAAPGAAIDAGEQKPAICGVLAGEPEVIGERCKDGGACHHSCTTVCFRREGNFCVPLTGSRLNDDWSEPASHPEAPAASAPAESGWQWVPKEPTISMCIAGDSARMNVDDLTITPAIYRQMLAAAPQAVQAGGEGGAT